METSFEDWTTSFEEIWKSIHAQEDKIEKLILENQNLKERIERLEAFNNII